MKAFVLREYNREMSLETVEDPVPGPFEIILRVKACGVCGTDLKIVSGKIPPPIVTLPHTLGHEIAGEVVAIGSAVQNVSVGQKGIAYFYIGCKDCEMCRTGRENVCYSIKRLGFELPGGFAEFVKMPSYNFCPLSDGGSINEMTVLADAVVTSYHGLKTMGEVKAGQDVLIMGTGGLGIHAVQIAKLMGARVIAVARRKGPLKLASELRADFVIDSSEENSSRKVMEITQGHGVDVVIENVGSSQSIGVVADSDHGSVYEAIVKYLDEYLNTPCKKHNIDPEICKDEDRSCVRIRHRDLVDIDLWTFEIPPTLDTQISNSLKRKYDELSQYENEDEIVRVAGELLKKSEEEVIRVTVKLLEDEKWFGGLCDALLSHLEI